MGELVSPAHKNAVVEKFSTTYLTTSAVGKNTSTASLTDALNSTQWCPKQLPDNSL